MLGEFARVAKVSKVVVGLGWHEGLRAKVWLGVFAGVAKIWMVVVGFGLSERRCR